MEKRLQAIEERNKRVEKDKAWESSFTRKSIIALLTYFIVAWVLHIIHATTPWLSAIIPTLGYLLSTLLLPPARKIWERYS